jgi:hypothetical protein
MVITGYKQSQSVMMIMIKKSLGNIPHDLLPVIGASLLFFDACGQRGRNKATRKVIYSSDKQIL